MQTRTPSRYSGNAAGRLVRTSRSVDQRQGADRASPRNVSAVGSMRWPPFTFEHDVDTGRLRRQASSCMVSSTTAAKALLPAVRQRKTRAELTMSERQADQTAAGHGRGFRQPVSWHGGSSGRLPVAPSILDSASLAIHDSALRCR